MGANAVKAGDTVTIAQLDALYKRLYNLYNTHKTSTHQTNSSFRSAAIPISNTSGHAAGSLVNPTTELSNLRSALSSLRNSTWIKSGTVDTTVRMTTGDFTLPSVGSLLKATDFNAVESIITTAEGTVPTYSSRYSNYSNYNNYKYQCYYMYKK